MMIIVSVALATIWLAIAIGPIDGLPQIAGQEGTFFVGENLNKEHQLARSPVKLAGDMILVGLKYLHGVYSNKTRKPPTDESDEMITARPERTRFEKRSINARKQNQISKSNQAERLIEEIDESDSPAADDTAVIRDGIAEYSVFEGDIKERQTKTFRELNEDFVETRRTRSILYAEKNEQSSVKNVDKQQKQTIVDAMTKHQH